MKKMIFMAIFALVSTSAFAFESTNFWDNESGDGKWTTALNWTDNVVPDNSSFGGLGVVDDLCTIDTVVSAKGFEMGITPGGQAKMLITTTGDATFSGSPTSVLAYTDGVGNSTAELTVEGKLTVGYQLSVGCWGWGTLNIQNGGIVKTGILYFNNGNLSNAKVNIIDGTLLVDIAIHYGLSSFGGFTIDIVDGELLVANPPFTAAAAQAWINLGFITGYGEEGNVKVEEVVVGGYDYVRLTAQCKMYPADGDIVRDCAINLTDFAKMASNWLNTGI